MQRTARKETTKDKAGALPPPSTLSNMIPPKWTCWRDKGTNKNFPTFRPAKWLKRNVSIFSTGKQEFACRRDVNYLNTLQTKVDSHLELFHSRIEKKESLLCQFST